MSRSPGRSVTELGPGDRSLDVSLDVLTDPYRRVVLARLAEADGKVGFDRLVDLVVDAADRGAIAVPTADRSRVATRLYHLHLPKLVDAGVVTHDDWESFEATDCGEAVSRLVDRVERAK